MKTAPAEAAEGTPFLGGDWFDPLEAGVRTYIRGFISRTSLKWNSTPRLGGTGINGNQCSSARPSGFLPLRIQSGKRLRVGVLSLAIMRSQSSGVSKFMNERLLSSRA